MCRWQGAKDVVGEVIPHHYLGIVCPTPGGRASDNEHIILGRPALVTADSLTYPGLTED